MQAVPVGLDVQEGFSLRFFHSYFDFLSCNIIFSCTLFVFRIFAFAFCQAYSLYGGLLHVYIIKSQVEAEIFQPSLLSISSSVFKLFNAFSLGRISRVK